MGGTRSARPESGAPASSDATVAIEHLTLTELHGAIERTVELFRADLQALDDSPVTLPDGPWPMPVAPTAEIHSAGIAPDLPPLAQPTAAPSSPGESPPARTESRRLRPWWLGALALIPAFAILAAAVAGRQPVPTKPMPSVAAQVFAPTLEGGPTIALAPPATAPAVAPSAFTTAVPTAIPMATSPPMPTNTPPTAIPPAPATLAAQIADLEAGLRSGTFEVAIEYGQGHRSSVIVRFDLGEQGGERRFALAATSTGRADEQPLELIAIGDRIWQRRPGDSWQPGVSQDGLWEQLLAYLPQIRGAHELTAARSGEVLVLRWADPSRMADIELQIAASDGRPLLLRETSPDTGVVMVVTYTGWNTPVSITPPSP